VCLFDVLTGARPGRSGRTFRTTPVKSTLGGILVVAQKEGIRLVTPYLYAVLRIIGALLYACHGAQKLLGLFGGVRGGMVPFTSLPGLAGVIELGAGLLIASGVLTRPAAFLASGEMAFAYWLAHAPRGFWPIRNGGEVAVVNCFLFLYIASQGAGPWSVAQWGAILHRVVPRRTVPPSPSG